MVNYDDYGSTAQDDDSGVNQKWTPTKGSIPGISSAEASNGQGLWNHPVVQGALDYLFPPAKEKDDKGPSGPRTEDVQAGKKMAADKLGAPYMGRDANSAGLWDRYNPFRKPDNYADWFSGGVRKGSFADDKLATIKDAMGDGFKGNQGFAGDPLKEQRSSSSPGEDVWSTKGSSPIPNLESSAFGGSGYAQAGPNDRPSTPLPSETDKGPTPRAGVDPGVHEDSLLGKYLQWRGDNRQTLAALSQGLLNVGFHQNAFSGMPQAAAGDIARSDLNQTAAMLARNGLAPDIALALSRNPQSLQAVLGQMTGATAPAHVITTDIAGNQHINIWNGKPIGQGGAFINAAGGGSGGDYTSMPIQIDPKTGRDENFLAAVKEQDPVTYSAVTDVLAGKIPATGRNMQKIIPLAARASGEDSGFFMQKYQQTQKAFNAWYGGGKQDERVRALDQVLDHAEQGAAAVDELGNFGGLGTLLNRPMNAAAMAVGRPGTGPLNMNYHALADEMSALWKTNHSSDTEIRAWEQNFPVNGSPYQQKMAMRQGFKLLHGAIDSLENQRQRDLGSAAAHTPSVMTPDMQARLERVEKWANSEGNPTTNKEHKKDLPHLTDPKEAAKLPKGTHFIDAHGDERIVP